MNPVLDAHSGRDEMEAEAIRLCTLHGDPEAGNFYAWSAEGLWRVPDKSEPWIPILGHSRSDMQEVLEMDVVHHVRLRARRKAIQGDGEPDWAMAIHPVTKVLLAHAGADPMLVNEDPEISITERNGVRIDTVTHSRGGILASACIGRSGASEVSFSSFLTHSEIRIHGARFPQTILMSITGAALPQILPHPLLDGLGLTIRKAQACPHWRNGHDTVFTLDALWEPLVADHPAPRPWIIPVPLPKYR